MCAFEADLQLNQKTKKNNGAQKEDLVLLKEELKQLEDPPVTLISSLRLLYPFYDTPCETLAKNMLGILEILFV